MSTDEPQNFVHGTGAVVACLPTNREKKKTRKCQKGAECHHDASLDSLLMQHIHFLYLRDRKVTLKSTIVGGLNATSTYAVRLNNTYEAVHTYR